jgi:hypothetical protein
MPTKDNDMLIGKLVQGQQDQGRRLSVIEDKLDDIAETLSGAKGGLKTLISVGSVAGVLGGLITQLIHSLWPK